MGTKHTIKNHKPYIICNQITRNTIALKNDSASTQKYITK